MSDDASPVEDADALQRRALAHIRAMLLELQAGELFCMDRGMLWNIKAEGYRREIIVDWFTSVPSLRHRLPTMSALLESGETIANRNGLIEEIDAAR